MKFKVPDHIGAVSHRGLTVTAKDGYVVIDTARPEDIVELAGHGLVFVPPEAEAAPAADLEKAEKDAVVAELDALGIKADKRKSLESLKALLEQTKNGGVT